MHPRLETTLVAAYPNVYRLLQPRCSGGSRFECDDGWYRLIDALSRRLESQARGSALRAIEVRERLGSLRFRVRGDVTDTVDRWLAAAGRASQRTCERCGRAATLRGHPDGRVRTLCPACATAERYVLA